MDFETILMICAVVLFIAAIVYYRMRQLASIDLNKNCVRGGMLLQLILGLIYTMAFPLIADAATHGHSFFGFKFAKDSVLGFIVPPILAIIVIATVRIFQAKEEKQRNSDEEDIQNEEKPSNSDKEGI